MLQKFHSGSLRKIRKKDIFETFLYKGVYITSKIQLFSQASLTVQRYDKVYFFRFKLYGISRT